MRWLRLLVGRRRLERRLSALVDIVDDVVSTSPRLPDDMIDHRVHGLIGGLGPSTFVDVRFVDGRGQSLRTSERDDALLVVACADDAIRAPVKRDLRIDQEGAASRRTELVREPRSATLRVATGPRRREAQLAALLRLRRWLTSDAGRPRGPELVAMIDQEIDETRETRS